MVGQEQREKKDVNNSNTKTIKKRTKKEEMNTRYINTITTKYTHNRKRKGKKDETENRT